MGRKSFQTSQSYGPLNNQVVTSGRHVYYVLIYLEHKAIRLISPWEWVIDIFLPFNQEGVVKRTYFCEWNVNIAFFMEMGDQEEDSLHSCTRILSGNEREFVCWKEEQYKGMCEGYGNCKCVLFFFLFFLCLHFPFRT